MSRLVFVDTWGWLALGHRADANHEAVKEVFRTRQVAPALLHTSDYVLDELITLLFRRETHEEASTFLDGLLADQVAGRLLIHRVTGERFLAALGLRRRFHDKPLISFTDLTSMSIMTELDIREVLSGDEHFLHVGMGFQRIP
ncbi:MAG TPA: PIN domain-containing protein [Verrucomicrobiae bacterium]|nr:PIN domain-containing protein [Verrucomicrobiae bacterium]